jgi:hypothetical protein
MNPLNPGKAHRGRARDDKRHRRERQHPAQVHRLQFGQVARVRAVINHPAHHGEEQPGDDAVRKHLQHRAAQADLSQASSSPSKTKPMWLTLE